MKIIIVGAGAAGMAAAASSAENGADVTILERNEKAGKKIYITGKGRCNFTNAAPIEDFYQNIVTNPKFMYSAFAHFDNQDMIKFIEDAGVPTKVERGGRLFPVSDHASDITRAFTQTLKRLGVKTELDTRVTGLIVEDGKVTGVKAAEEGHLSHQKEYRADAVILAAGGKSYPTTGSDGNLIPMLKDLGLKVNQCYPALVPLETEGAYIPQMQGLSLKNVELRIFSVKKKKPVYDEFGEMLFTHFGISGPIVLSASSKIAKILMKEGTLKGEIDLKPHLSEEKLRNRLIRIVEENPNRNFSHFFDDLLPSKMIPVMVDLTGIDPPELLQAQPFQRVFRIDKEDEGLPPDGRIDQLHALLSGVFLLLPAGAAHKNDVAVPVHDRPVSTACGAAGDDLLNLPALQLRHALRVSRLGKGGIDGIEGRGAVHPRRGIQVVEAQRRRLVQPGHGAALHKRGIAAEVKALL